MVLSVWLSPLRRPGVVAVVERPGTGLAGLPRSRFTALLVAESPHRRAFLAARLRGLGARDVIEAASAAEARVRARHESSQELLIVDGGLPDSPVLPLLAELRQLGWRRVVLLTVRDDSYAVRAAMAGGARGYLVTADHSVPDPLPFVAVNRSRSRSGSPDDLSAREVEVLQLVAEGHSNKTVGEDLGLSALTVKSHLARIARKLGTGDRAEMVALSMRAGLVR